jgi:HAD superfamily hydrolase (TIGR01484 family)
MKAITALDAAEARRLDGLLFDLDDTFLSEGKLSEAAYSSLFRLQESGLLLLSVTGRPLSWGKLLARQWPLAGAICENGAVAAYTDAGRVELTDSVVPTVRGRLRAKLAEVVSEIRAEFPALESATDADERLTDYTFDIGEYQTVPLDVVRSVGKFAEQRGARTFVSSVHLHVSFDSHDKASGAVAFLRTRFGYDPTALRSRFAYIGDSENDAPCFAAFGTTIGVKNLRGRPTVLPRFITTKPHGEGFAEAARAIIAARS